MKPEGKTRFGLIAVIVLAALGVGFSIELLSVHLAVHADPNANPSCNINQQVNCSIVAMSEQATLLGVPVPVWGIITYLAFGVLGILGLKAEKQPWQNARDYVLPMAAWSVAYSAFLCYIAAFVLKTVCIYCACLYVVNLLMLVAGIFSAAPLGGYLSRRREDLDWLKARPTVIGFIAGAAVMAISLIGYLYYLSARVPPPPQTQEGVEIDVTEDPMIGPRNAPISIIEFSDYECPACRKMHPVIKQLMKEYPGKIRLFNKNFPLNPDCNPKVKFRLHEYACNAAAAAECALQMGKFEAYSNVMWEADNISLPGLLRIASDNGLDPTTFQGCLYDPKTQQKILKDVNAGLELNINATPTFIINGYKFSGYTNIEDARKMIDSLLATGKMPPIKEEPPK